MSQATQQRVVNINWRDAYIAYTVDEKSVADLATQYDIEWTDMKKALIAYGITVRKAEKQPEGTKNYKVVLVDTAKVVTPAKQAAALQD